MRLERRPRCKRVGHMRCGEMVARCGVVCVCSIQCARVFFVESCRRLRALARRCPCVFVGERVGVVTGVRACRVIKSSIHLTPISVGRASRDSSSTRAHTVSSTFCFSCALEFVVSERRYRATPATSTTPTTFLLRTQRPCAHAGGAGLVRDSLCKFQRAPLPARCLHLVGLEHLEGL